MSLPTDRPNANSAPFNAEEPQRTSSSGDVGRLVGPIVGIIVVLIIFTILVYLWRRETAPEHELERASEKSDLDVDSDLERGPTPEPVYRPRNSNRDAPKIRSVHFDSFADNLLPPPYTKTPEPRKPEPAVVRITQ
ncbi:hypothetical protein Dda_5679 [Drechslerella dactyloides]|uniref:Uncharacterized protein n=1 Tax=Drechslerella dactyloides TaxID=74499 RepID=A0AAD6NKF3_DREDA|nr:hypothetical protein Dda_5679 [Drechslerella dactyloides]